MVEKYMRGDDVAVLYSPGYGAGWSTWTSEPAATAMLFDPEIAVAVEDGDLVLALEIAQRKYPKAYLGGLQQLKIAWLPKETMFTIDEYDGYESVVTIGNTDWRVT
jgi:hypothetical protein